MAACSPAAAQQQPASTAVPPTAAAPTQAPVPALSADQVMNMSVQLVSNDQHPVVQLKDGVYHTGADASGADFADVRLVKDHIAFGDLNGDGAVDAAALMSENYGGSGVFVSVLAVLNSGGQPTQAGAAPVDDRPQLGALEIKDGQIVFTGTIHGPTDPGCCAALPVSENFGLTKGGLQLQQLASGNPLRSITIDSPTSGTQVPAGPVKVKGSVTVAPFENTLAYHAYDATGKEWAQGSLPVSAAAPGAPGTFNAPVDLGAVPAGVIVQLEISDVSAADGSKIAMDSIELMIK